MGYREASTRARRIRGSAAAVVVLRYAKLMGVLVAAASLTTVASNNANAAVCENETLRSELGSSLLPECRAYEMVTPPYKNGQPFFVERYSSDGSKIILDSLGGIVNIPGSGESVVEPDWYLADRTTDGWRMSAMNPPVSEFVGQVPDVQEAGNGMSLWTQHTPKQSAKTAELYLRSANGEYSRVGTLSPNAFSEMEESEFLQIADQLFVSRPIAATDTYEHIVIRAAHTGSHWFFDKTTGEESLYEYSGLNNSQPILVAVAGSKGSGALLALCGAAFGSGPRGSSYNALSRDGETIFFTLEPCSGKPAEVYARLHGSLATPDEAESVDISESDCHEECGSESGKNFEGAAESGEKAFFTSTQKLTASASNLTSGGNAAEKRGCAAATSGCNLYEYNFTLPAGERLTLVAGGSSDVRGVAGMAENGERIYFVANGQVSGSGENEFHDAPSSNEPNLYMYDTDTGKIAFIATLSEADEEVWTRKFDRPVEVAGEGGRFLLFASAMAGVTSDERSEGVVQLFEYDAETSELVRITQGEEGYDSNGNGVAYGVEQARISNMASRLGELRDFKTTGNVLNLSSDGQTVVFETTGELSPRAATSSGSGCTSVYEFHSDGQIATGKVHLLSDGRDVQLYKGAACGAKFDAMDETGTNVLVSTDDPLLTSDVDGSQPDVYDVRVNGGFPLNVQGQEIGLCPPARCNRNAGASPGGLVPSSAMQSAEGPLSTATLPAARVTVPLASKTAQPMHEPKSGKLANALRACRTHPTKRKAACERNARRRFELGKRRGQTS